MSDVGRYRGCTLQGVLRFAKFPDGHNDYEPDKTKGLVWFSFFEEEKWIYKKTI